MTHDTTHQTHDTPITRLDSVQPAETISAVLGSPIDRRHLRQLKKRGKNGDVVLDYYPWGVIAKCLHARTPGWQWSLTEIKQIGDYVLVSGKLTIPCGNTTLSYEAVASERIDSPGAPPVEVAASACLRRAAALANLGLDLYLD